MKEAMKLWARFEKSGKLSDYMEFCEARRREASPRDGAKQGEAEPQSSL